VGDSHSINKVRLKSGFGSCFNFFYFGNYVLDVLPGGAGKQSDDRTSAGSVAYRTHLVGQTVWDKPQNGGPQSVNVAPEGAG
jgi:hypothetical protein